MQISGNRTREKEWEKITSWKRRFGETPWNKRTFWTIGKKRWCAMLVRIALGRPLRVSSCFNASVLNLRHMWDKTWSCTLGGNWFLFANSWAAFTVSLCKTKIPKFNFYWRSMNFNIRFVGREGEKRTKFLVRLVQWTTRLVMFPMM